MTATPPRLLFVCTANRCRSPMAATLMREIAERRGLALDVSSAGLLEAGEPAMPGAIAVLAERGLDLRAHRSRQLDHHVVDSSDLVVGMERQHVREAVLRSSTGDAFARSFTLRELVRRGAQAGARSSGEPLRAWLDRLQTGRRHSDLLGASPADDIADPIGQGRDAFRATAKQLDELLETLGALLLPAQLVAAPARSATHQSRSPGFPPSA